MINDKRKKTSSSGQNKGFQEKIAESVTDIIAGENATGRKDTAFVTWLGFLLIILAIVHVTTSSAMDMQTKVLVMASLMYLYQCVVILVSAVIRISQKAASILGIVAMFTVTYEESGLNVMRSFFDGISKAAEQSDVDSQAETEGK